VHFVGEDISRLGRNQLLGAFLVFAYGEVFGISNILGQFGPSEIVYFLVLATFVGFVIDLASRSFAVLLFRGVIGITGSKSKTLFEERTTSLREIAKQEDTINSLLSTKNEYYVWKVAAKFLREGPESSISPVEDFDRSVAYFFVGLLGLVGSALSIILGASRQACSSGFLCEYIDAATLVVAVLLLLAARSEADEFTEGTLAGTKDRLRKLKESERLTARPSVDVARVNHVSEQLDGAITRFPGSAEPIRVHDSILVTQLFQDSNNINTLSIKSVREKAAKVLDGIGYSGNNQLILGNLLIALHYILLRTEDLDVYAEFERRFAPLLAPLGLRYLVNQDLQAFHNQYLEPVRLMESPDLAEALLQALGTIDVGTGMFNGVVDAIANSHIGDCNQRLVRERLLALSQQSGGFAQSVSFPLSVMERRLGTTEGSLERVPQLVHRGILSRTGLPKPSK
jgi:hypothetical protein